MPHRIIIIDDRVERPAIHLDEGTLAAIRSLENVEISSAFPEDGLDAYDVVAVHRSLAITIGKADMLYDLAGRGDKYVVLFSGGVGQSQVDYGEHLAVLGAETFYSKNLLPFCRDLMSAEEVHLYKLIYGTERWRLPLLLQLRQLSWKDPEGKDFDVQEEIEEIRCALGLAEGTDTEEEISKLIARS